MTNELIKRMSELTYIRGGRIIIYRVSTIENPAKILEAREESFDDLKPWMGWSQEKPTLEGIKQELKDAETLRENLASYRFHIYRAPAKFLGGIGIIRYGAYGKSAELGYWMRTSVQRMGYTREALALMSLYLMKIGLNRIEVRADIDNHRSIKVASSIGMKMDGVLRADRFKIDGRLSSTAVLSFVKDLDGIEFDFGDIKVEESRDGKDHITTLSAADAKRYRFPPGKFPQ